MPPQANIMDNEVLSFRGGGRVGVLKGENDHHRAEAMCTALGRALCAATRVDPRRAGDVPSTKGTLGG